MPPRTYRSLDLLKSEMRRRVIDFLEDVEAQNLSIIVTETWRSRERQEYLYSLGRTRPGSIVTWTKKSKHMIGEAVDVVFVGKQGRVTYRGNWEKLGRIGERNGLAWGGRWRKPDRPHFELNHDFLGRPSRTT